MDLSKPFDTINNDLQLLHQYDSIKAFSSLFVI